MRTRAIGLLVGTALIAISPSAVGRAAAPLPRLLTADFGKTFAVKPAAIVVSGDGSAIIAGTAAWIGRNPTPNKLGSQFGHIQWLGWKANAAGGFATLWLNNCKPDCAQGTYFPTSVVIGASRVRGDLFTRLSVRATSGKKTYLYTLQHGGTGYVWNASSTN